MSSKENNINIQDMKKGSWQHLEYIRNNFPKCKGEEIPKDIPFEEYDSYIKENVHLESEHKPIPEWTDMDYKEQESKIKRLLMIYFVSHEFEQGQSLSERKKRIIERIRIGEDFNVSLKEECRLLEKPYTVDFEKEWEEQYFKEHPEDKDKDYADILDKMWQTGLSQKQLCHYQKLNGRFYGAEIPKEIPYIEYARYLCFNIKYEYVEKTIKYEQYTEKDILEKKWHNQRLLVAIEISNWRENDLEDWQREIIEKVRIGVELEDDDIVKAMGY